MHILSPETDNCPSWISGRERMTVENISWSIPTKECCRPRRGLNPRPPGLQSDGASNWATEAGYLLLFFHKVHVLLNIHVHVFTTSNVAVTIISPHPLPKTWRLIFCKLNSMVYNWSTPFEAVSTSSVWIFCWFMVFYKKTVAKYRIIRIPQYRASLSRYVPRQRNTAVYQCTGISHP